jgi:hypothetical protein
MFDRRSKVFFQYADILQENYKVPDEDVSIWADYDEDSHEVMECFENDPHHALGVFRACYERIPNPDCMFTKHEATEDSTVPIAERKKSKPATTELEE